MKTLALAALLVTLAAGAEPPPLTPAETEACARDRQAFDARHAALTAESARLTGVMAEIERNERDLEHLQAEVDADRAALQALRERVEKSSTLESHLQARTQFDIARESFEAKVKRYNDSVRAQQARRDPYNRDARLLNEQIAALDADKKRIDGSCAGRRPAR